MRIFKYGEKVLKAKAKHVYTFDDELKKFAEEMTKTLYEENGLGLAAPQVGVSKRMFVIDMRKRLDEESPCDFLIDGKKLPMDLAMPLVAINPEVEELGEFVIVSQEGCLSFPGIFAEVERAEKVRLDYFDTDGVKHYLICDDLFARCVQHESDHLDGICFIDRLPNKELFKIDTKLKKLRRQTRDFLKEKKSADEKNPD